MPDDRDKLKKSPGGAEDFSLESILAEFGGGSTRRREEVSEDTAVPVAPPRRARTQAPKKGQDAPADSPPPQGKPAGGAPEKAPPPKQSAPKKSPSEKASTAAGQRGNVVPFPAGQRDPDGGTAQPDFKSGDTVSFQPIRDLKPKAAQRAPAEKPPSSKTAPPKEAAPPPREGKVLSFPEEKDETFFTAKLGEIRKKADDYADHMFEHAGIEARKDVRMAEKYIPGVDEEEEDTSPLPRERKKRRLRPSAPDYSPAELYRRYSKGLGLFQLRMVLVFLLALPMLYLTVFQYAGAPLPVGLAGDHRRQVYTLVVLMAGAMLLGIDQLLLPLVRFFRLRIGLDTLTTLACAATLADALTVLKLEGRQEQLPYCGVCVLALAMNMLGAYLKQRGQRQACRTASAAHRPYLVTLDEGRWNNRDAYTKWSGEAAGFGSQLQADDGAERIFQVASPLLLIACVAFSLLASQGQEKPENLLWCLSATLTAAATFSGTLCYGIPWSRLNKRLSGCGAALAGWDGVLGSSRGVGILLTDVDLFPPGAVTLNGIKVFGDFSVEKVVGCAASLIRDSGSALDKPFHDLLRSQGAIYRQCEEFRCHEGGGLSAAIRGQQVLVGSASFMHLCQIPLPQGLNVKNAVFCAIDGSLAGIFALNYSLHQAVRPSLSALIHNRISPVLATRDFNLTPAMLEQRFKLPVDRMEYPSVERRVELSDGDAPHSTILSAVLSREGLFPFSEAVVGAARLRTAVRLSSLLTVAGGTIGVLLAFYLTFAEAYASLSPANLLIFLLMWTVPTVLISGWVERY